MDRFVSPGVYVQEKDITIVRPFSKRYLRRIKISKIFTSTPKGSTNTLHFNFL